MSRVRPLLGLALVALVAGCSLGGDDDEATTQAAGGTGTTVAATTVPTKEGFRPVEEGAEIEAAITAPQPFPLKKWVLESDNVYPVQGTVTIDGLPVVGARVSVGGYGLPAPTDAQGAFQLEVDSTLSLRREVTVTDLSEARVGGYRLSPDEESALRRASAAINVGYQVSELQARPQPDGTTVVTGRVGYDDGTPPPPVSFFSFELVGDIVDANGAPVANALVSTRTIDRDHWTLSKPSDERGRYASLFGASAAEPGDPVPFDVRVAIGDDVFSFLFGERVLFRRLMSARMDIQLPPPGFPMALPETDSYEGASYEGVLVGATDQGEPVRPVSATWPDRDGRFEFVLPPFVAGKEVAVWASRVEVFQEKDATPGGPVNVRRWPTTLDPKTPQDLTALSLTR